MRSSPGTQRLTAPSAVPQWPGCEDGDLGGAMVRDQKKIKIILHTEPQEESILLGSGNKKEVK